MAGFGAVVGPAALAWGLQRTSGSSASLMLTLEALFTAVLPWKLYGESMDKRVGAAMLLLLARGMALVLEQGIAGKAPLLGLLAVLAATAAWGVANTLSRGVAERDPGQVVLAKASLGASATVVLALMGGEPVPGVMPACALLAVGATGYGLSLRLYLLAQREFGAGRTGSVFAFAPFIGALGALAFGDRSASWMMAITGTAMATCRAEDTAIGTATHLPGIHIHMCLMRTTCIPTELRFP
jgi:drug/metabolite transporter (DMT)-like permease